MKYRIVLIEIALGWEMSYAVQQYNGYMPVLAIARHYMITVRHMFYILHTLAKKWLNNIKNYSK